MENKSMLIKNRSYRFALQIIGLYQNLCNKKEFVLSKQLLRAGTSIGANVEEATAAQSRRDFISKMSIASKEARETLYWLKLPRDSNLYKEIDFNGIIDEAEQVAKMLTAIVKTTQKTTQN